MDIREIIIEKIENKEDMTLLLPVAEAVNFIDEYVEFDKVEYMEEDFEQLCDIVSISLVNGEEWYIEDAFYGDEIKYMESDLFIIDKDILPEIDMERLEGSIVISDFTTELEDSLYDNIVCDDIYEEECECCCGLCEDDEITFAMDDIVEDTLIKLENSECDWCTVEEAVKKGYHIGYFNALRMMRSAIDEILED